MKTSLRVKVHMLDLTALADMSFQLCARVKLLTFRSKIISSSTARKTMAI